MFRKTGKTERDGILEIVNRLIKISKTDSVYRDIYLYRARNLLSNIMSLDEYHNLLKERGWMSQLPKKIGVAMEKGDWKTVKELSEEMVSLKKWEEDNHIMFDIGNEIYETDEMSIDPFSPGLNHLIGIPSENLPRLRDSIVKLLKELQSNDPDYKKFYSTRTNAFESLSLVKLEKGDPEMSVLDEMDLQERAQQALNTGDMELLEQIAELRLNQTGSMGSGPGHDGSTGKKIINRAPRIVKFTETTLTNAQYMGFQAVHLDESREYESLFRYAFHPVVRKEPEKAWEMMKSTETEFPADIPKNLKKYIELYAIHTFFNSGGSRYFPDFIAEDCLVEFFSDTQEGMDDQGSELLSELGLKGRRGLSRKQIEHSLLQNGSRILKERLGLDPETFRLTCIPPDIYFRLGQSFNWGLQEIWTHFDGYQTSQRGKLKALAGGDKRFGGIYDLVSIGREYTSDHVIARFAVIQRKRMEAW